MEKNILDSNNSPPPVEEVPLLVSMLFLFFTITVSAMIGLAIIALLGYVLEVDFSGLLSGLSENSSPTNRNFLRLSILINHLTMFVLPGIAFGIFRYRERWTNFLNLDKSPTITNIVGSILLLLVSMPFVQFIFCVNQTWIPLPEWARTMEANTADAISNLLVADSSFEFLFNVVIIALIPAVGEELIFRGIIQKQLQNSFRNAVLGVWVAAFIFSAFHMQFEGFLPRFVLGAILGYLYYWSGNLWIPIIAHFMNNFLQILIQYLFQKEISDVDLDSIEMIPMWQWVPSLFLIFTVGYFLQQYNKDTKTPVE